MGFGGRFYTGLFESRFVGWVEVISYSFFWKEELVFYGFGEGEDIGCLFGYSDVM